MLEQQRFRGTRRNWVWIAAIVVILAGGAYWWSTRTPADGTTGSGAADAKGGGKGGKGGSGRNQQVPVVMVPAKSGEIGVYINGLGSVMPLNTVTVKTRIDGQLMKVLFREGQIVKEGDLLAEIDPRTYEAQLLQAQGQMARDEALLKNARLDLERYRTLFQQDSIARQQVDTQESLVKQDEGLVKIDQAAIDTAKLQLTYCKITAPVGGRLGLRQVDPGNIVHASDTNGLVVITQLQPITVVYTIPEDSVPSVMKRLQAGEKLPTEAWDRAEKVKLATGTLLTMDNQIDPTTGTVKLKAQFANTDYALFPMQFVNTHMLVETKRDAIIIPTAAVQRGTPGTFVYVVKPDSTVTVRVIKLGPTLADRAAVESGVAAGENVVVDGADKLREGAKVEVANRNPGGGTPGAGGKGKGGGQHNKKGDGAKGDASAPAAPAAPVAAAPGATSASTPADTAGVQQSQNRMERDNSMELTPEQKAARWAAINARIDKGEFGEDVKKLPQEERKKKMRELRKQRDADSNPQ